ncbi:MAG: pectin acetylesterase-family hydrolase [Pseudomonadota bacterium]
MLINPKIFVIASMVVLAPLRVSAETGDYSSWQAFFNLFFPPGADNPVTNAEATAADYPLLDNPAGFNDGFSRGDYYKWQTVQLHPTTGAMCSNGSPYKFFINRVPTTRNTVFYFEGGGACWDYPGCTGADGVRSARNRDGIPDDYVGAGSPETDLVSPFIFRLHPYTRAKTQDWNLVYVPYCTGDVYSGDELGVYTDEGGSGETIMFRHNGVKNVRAAVAWMKNNMPRPGQLLMTGCSAGGAGSFTNYHPTRRDMDATKNFLINDSGPIFPTDRNGPVSANPSQRLHEQIISAWGLSEVFDYLQNELVMFNQHNLGTLNTALALNYLNDRLGHVGYQRDENYSSYSYERFFDEISNEPDPEKRRDLILEKWAVDTQKFADLLNTLPNYGGYFPYFRDLNESHCATIVDFENGDIQERNLELADFVDSVLDGGGPVLDAKEADTVSDEAKPFNAVYALVNLLLGF